jgi:hypothetical protein
MSTVLWLHQHVKSGMAMENETWDIWASPRWCSATLAIVEGKPQAEVEQKIRRAFRLSWLNINRQLTKYEFPLQQIVDAVIRGDDDFIRRAERATKHHEFVTIIGTSGSLMGSAGDILERAALKHLTLVKQQVRDHLLAKGICRSPAEATQSVEPAFAAVLPDVKQFAQNLIDSPRKATQFLRVPREAEVCGEMPANLLGISIVNTDLHRPGVAQ